MQRLPRALLEGFAQQRPEMSLFVASTCQVLGDVIVNHSAWSKVDQIAALSAYTVDENDLEINQVLFTNNEVIRLI